MGAEVLWELEGRIHKEPTLKGKGAEPTRPDGGPPVASIARHKELMVYRCYDNTSI